MSIVPVGQLVTAWTEIKRGRELQLRHLRNELARVEATVRIEADGWRSE
jgi:hypothetical protein